MSATPVFAPMNEGECKRAIDTFGLPAADPTGMYRMSLVNHLRYDTSFPIGQGLDYILRVGEQHPMVVLGECLYGYRVLPRSNTRGDPTLRERLIANVLKQACDRRGLDYGHLYPHRTGHKWRSRASVRDNNLAAHFIKSVLDQLRAGCRLDAIRTGIACAHLQPFDPHYYKALVYALSSPDIVKFVRRKALAK